jgi:hypothetical protein
LKKLQISSASFDFEMVNSLQQLRELDLQNCIIVKVKKISLPLLCKLYLVNIKTSCSNLNDLFREFCGTLKCLSFNEVKIQNDATLNIYFTALEDFTLNTETEDENIVFDRLLESIGGSVNTLTYLNCTYQAKKFKVGLFKNIEDLSCLQVGKVKL